MQSANMYIYHFNIVFGWRDLFHSKRRLFQHIFGSSGTFHDVNKWHDDYISSVVSIIWAAIYTLFDFDDTPLWRHDLSR